MYYCLQPAKLISQNNEMPPTAGASMWAAFEAEHRKWRGAYCLRHTVEHTWTRVGLHISTHSLHIQTWRHLDTAVQMQIKRHNL